jgi:hypothetical protein
LLFFRKNPFHPEETNPDQEFISSLGAIGYFEAEKTFYFEKGRHYLVQWNFLPRSCWTSQRNEGGEEVFGRKAECNNSLIISHFYISMKY